MTPSTLCEMLFHSLQKYNRPDRLRYKAVAHYRSIGDSELAERIRDVSLGLADIGIGKGDRVAILSYNRPEWLIADYAILTAGAVTVPLYSTLPAEACREILYHSEARALLVSDREQWAKVEPIRSSLPALKTVVTMDCVNPDAMTMSDLSERGAKSKASLHNERAGTVRPEDSATIIYTSGTTGVPKGVVLTHRNLMSNVLAVGEALQITDQDSTLSFLPLSHSFERMVDYVMFHAGASIAYPESMDTVADNLVETSPTILCGVPRFYEKIHAAIMQKALDSGSFRRNYFRWALAVGRSTLPYRLNRQPLPFRLKWRRHFAGKAFARIHERLGGRIRLLISGGAPLAPSLIEFFMSAGFTLLEGYGLTETSPVAAVNREGSIRIGSVGQPVGGVDVRAADDGELLIRGPNVMAGYFKDPEETARTIRDGWLYSGDIGRIDADGYVTITDRKKELIKTAGGKYIAPQPIENKLKESPYISNAVVIGDRRPYAVALIVPDMAQVQRFASERRIYNNLLEHPEVVRLFQSEIDRTNAGLASFETLKSFALLRNDLSMEHGELTPTMKLRRKAIEERHHLLIDTLYP